MRVTATFRTNFPLLAAWLTTNIPRVRRNPRVFRAFCRYAELNRRSAVEALNVGSNPDICFRHMPGANGEFEGATHPNTVFLAREICLRFENNAADRRDPRMHRLLESTVLHEMVHWGDWQDGVDQAGEEGKAFERAAYGRDIDRYW